MKVSKVVMIVVALHVLVIGGIFVFEGCSRAKAPAPDLAANEAPADQAALPAGLPADQLAAVQSLAPQPGLAPLAPAGIAAAPVAPVAPAPAARSHTVKKGDTLWGIAKSEGISIAELSRANNLTKTSTLKIGQKLTIPAKAEAAVVAAAPVAPVTTSTTVGAAPVATDAIAGGSTYSVKSGDSLWKIAKAHNISVAALKQANNLTSDALKINQKLTLPAPTATAAAPTAQASVSTASYSEWNPGPVTENGQQFHIVDIGESPAIIAKKHGIKVEDLMRANNITSGKPIMVGQRLVIPAATQPVAAVPPVPAPAIAAPVIQ